MCANKDLKNEASFIEVMSISLHVFAIEHVFSNAHTHADCRSCQPSLKKQIENIQLYYNNMLGNKKIHPPYGSINAFSIIRLRK